MKIRITATWEYEPNPDDYPGGASPAFMMETDRDGYRDLMVQSLRDVDNIEIKGEVIQ